MEHTTMAIDVLGQDMPTEDRLPILCEIIRKTEHLQVRAIAVLYADKSWKSRGSWSAFCKSEFGWDDSYASRMKKAGLMVLSGVTITNESQARALATIDPDDRNDVLEKAREQFGGEPSASQIQAVDRGEDNEDDGSSLDEVESAKDEIDCILNDMRAILKRIKSLPKNGAGKWINMSHVIADMKTAADSIKHGRPHGPCDEDGPHDHNCLCGGLGWLPKNVIDRPKEMTNGK